MERSFRSRSPSISVDGDYVDDRRGGVTPAHRILVAIVRRAIWDFVLYQDENPKQYKPEKIKDEKLRREIEKKRKASEAYKELATDAAGWLFWDGEEAVDSEGRYTFRYICDILGLDPGEVRRRALDMTPEDIKSVNNNIKEY